MRQFTEAEKQQLQEKIKDYQERRLKGSESESSNAKYSFLILILIPSSLIVINLLVFRSFGIEEFGVIVIILLALFGHIATHFAKAGWRRRLLKTVERVFILLALAYIAYQVWLRFAVKLTVTLQGE